MARILGAYFIDKHCCGHYPYGDDGLTKFSTNHFKELARFDKTEDYRIASVLDPDHFGCCKIHWDLKKILHSALLILLDPCHIHKLIESKATNWMYTHFGKDAWECSYGKEHQKQQRAVNLWWLLLEKKEEAALTSGK